MQRPTRVAGEPFPDSVGIGHYPIDLHPSTAMRSEVYIPACPFRIPLGTLLPVRVRNVIAAGKAIGVTHIANGCTRLHPVEWNVGEAAAAIVKVCREKDVTPQELGRSKPLIHEVQMQLTDLGVLTSWGDLPVYAL